MIDSTCLSRIPLILVLSHLSWGCDRNLAAQAADSSPHPVDVAAYATRWPGEARIEEKVVPLRVEIRNGASEAIQVRHADFTLITSQGNHYQAIRPEDVRGTVENAEPIVPVFRFSGFRSAPYGVNYLGIKPYFGPLHYDGVYRHRYEGHWNATAELPTDEMLARGLPAGVVEPGGHLDGFIYFPKPEQTDASAAVLQVDLSTAAGESVSSFELPLQTDSDAHAVAD